eukprot:2744699-Amphidinium_carterae.1
MGAAHGLTQSLRYFALDPQDSCDKKNRVSKRLTGPRPCRDQSRWQQMRPEGYSAGQNDYRPT